MTTPEASSRASHNVLPKNLAWNLIVALVLAVTIQGSTSILPQSLHRLGYQTAGANASAPPAESSSAWTALAVAPSGLSTVEPWMGLIDQASRESGVPREVIGAIVAIESEGDPYAVSAQGAVGLMQIMPSFHQTTADRFGGDLYDPWVNIRTGAEILYSGYAQYGNWLQAAAAYFGALDTAGNITRASDANGTSGYEYVARFQRSLAALGFQPGALVAPGSDPSAVPGSLLAFQYALAATGMPYVWGGDSVEDGGFDCSGLIYWGHAAVEQSIPRVALDQWNGIAAVDGSELRPGDLIFFENTSGPGITHVGIYAGDGLMLHSPSEGSVVRIDRLDSPYWQEHLAGYRRVGQQ